MLALRAKTKTHAGIVDTCARNFVFPPPP